MTLYRLFVVVRRWLDLAARMRTERETYLALRSLDRNALHDLGIRAGEIHSLAGEACGLIDRTRIHARTAPA